ncbi:hypothetical protein M409DRAFT_27658 [Zasmidium cellare ATCC 36951]|uniref:Uncharacterized protein n=1 Tax=Zasmidium cellare ATCC 36951 TaxID=1080233 RepID=A0A6A6C7Q3_ZASCE|nr:uncharacterized protein M409DRAFT_27658 [Zasmidium cellare ATCC 36951]KAF2161932.1 hypothetical protein M409DRAFT_27658 [Zasmidium cellare ATCC 36951]
MPEPSATYGTTSDKLPMASDLDSTLTNGFIYDAALFEDNFGTNLAVLGRADQHQGQNPMPTFLSSDWIVDDGSADWNFPFSFDFDEHGYTGTPWTDPNVTRPSAEEGVDEQVPLRQHHSEALQPCSSPGTATSKVSPQHLIYSTLVEDEETKDNLETQTERPGSELPSSGSNFAKPNTQSPSTQHQNQDTNHTYAAYHLCYAATDHSKNTISQTPEATLMSILRKVLLLPQGSSPPSTHDSYLGAANKIMTQAFPNVEQEFEQWLQRFQNDGRLLSTTDNDNDDLLSANPLDQQAPLQHENFAPVAIWNPVNASWATTNWPFNDASADSVANSIHNSSTAVNGEQVFDQQFHQIEDLFDLTEQDIADLLTPFDQVNRATPSSSRDTNGLDNVASSTGDMVDSFRNVHQYSPKNAHATLGPDNAQRSHDPLQSSPPQTSATQYVPLTHTIV